MTLQDIYKATKEEMTPAQKFIFDITKVTCRETTTVRQWVLGLQMPPRLARVAIAKHLNKPVEELFPGAENQD